MYEKFLLSCSKIKTENLALNRIEHIGSSVWIDNLTGLF